MTCLRSVVWGILRSGRIVAATLVLSVSCFTESLLAQSASGILPSDRVINWSAAGIPGGIPSRSTICATWYNGSSAPGSGVGKNGDYYFQTSVGHGSAEFRNASGAWTPTGNEFVTDLNKVLGGCPSGSVVSLSAGTYYVAGNIQVPSNVTLRGAGADATILNAQGSGGAVVMLGDNGFPNTANSVSITGGNGAGSTNLSLSSTSGISTGMYLMITELNDSSYVSIAGSEGSCNWCDGGIGWNGTRVRGQIAEVKSVSGNSVTISPALFSAYSKTPLATPFSASAKYAGVENLQIYANNTGYTTNFAFGACAYCWLSGVEGNYTDGDHVQLDWSYSGQVVNSYFSNAYLHAAGNTDSDLAIRNKSTSMLIQNNIFERLHVSVMLDWGPAGNVVAYNYSFGNFHAPAPQFAMGDIDMHGAHPQFNLFEGNIIAAIGADSTWGSHANNTSFRNWLTGTTKICNPMSGRGTVTCSGSNSWYPFQALRAVNLTFLSTNFSLVGNVVGSQQMATLTGYGTPQKQANMVVAVCGPSPCGPGSRAYDGTVYAYSFGYGEAADDGGSGFDSLTPYSTVFWHGDYSNVTGSTHWTSGVTQSLPPSFYLSSKPSWWGSMPYPAIGPDVAGGPGPGGHAYANPAQVCYNNVMGGTDGTNSPLSFNAAKCYGGGSGNPPPQRPVAPTNLSAVPH